MTNREYNELKKKIIEHFDEYQEYLNKYQELSQTYGRMSIINAISLSIVLDDYITPTTIEPGALTVIINSIIEISIVLLYSEVFRHLDLRKLRKKYPMLNFHMSHRLMNKIVREIEQKDIDNFKSNMSNFNFGSKSDQHVQSSDDKIVEIQELRRLLEIEKSKYLINEVEDNYQKIKK